MRITWKVCISDGSDRSGEEVMASEDPSKAAEEARRLTVEGSRVVLVDPGEDEYEYDVLEGEFRAVDPAVPVPEAIRTVKAGAPAPGPDLGPSAA